MTLLWHLSLQMSTIVAPLSQRYTQERRQEGRTINFGREHIVNHVNAVLQSIEQQNGAESLQDNSRVDYEFGACANFQFHGSSISKNAWTWGHMHAFQADGPN